MACLTGGLRKKRFDYLSQIGALALRTPELLSVVLLDAQHFGKLMIAVSADVFVKRHKYYGDKVRLSLENNLP